MGIYNSAPTTSWQIKLLTYVFIVVFILVVIVLHFIQARFLNKFNQEINQKKSILPWIPIGNLYFLGKLIFNDIVGAIASLLCLYSVYVYYSREEVMTLNLIVITCMYVYAGILYFNIKREHEGTEVPKMSNTPSMMGTESTTETITEKTEKVKSKFFNIVREKAKKLEKEPQEEPVETYAAQPMQAPQTEASETPTFKPPKNPNQTSSYNGESLSNFYNNK